MSAHARRPEGRTTDRPRPSRGVLTVVVAAVLAVVLPHGLAGADPAVSIDPNPAVVGAEEGSAQVNVSWSGLTPGQLVFVDVCWKSISDASFDPALDCGQYSQITPNATADGMGQAAFEVFRGQDPAGENWGCYAAGDTEPPGVWKHTTCYVRVTDTVVSNLDNDVEVPFTFVGSDRVDPGSTAGGGDPAAAPTLPSSTGGSVAPVGVAAPTGDPAPGESLQVAGGAGVAGVSIAG